MSRKSDKYLGILVILAVLFANTIAGFAESGMKSLNFTTDPESDPGPEAFSSGFEELDFEDSADPDSQFLQKLQQELNMSKTGYRQLLNNISDMKMMLDQVSEEKLTLNSQLQNLDAIINFTTGKLINVIKQVVEKENEIILLYEQIEIKEIELEYQKNLLRDYVRIMYQQENTYFTIGENGNIEAFKMLLADGSVGENLRELKYLDLLNEAGQQMLDELAVISTELTASEAELIRKKARLAGLQAGLEEEKAQLELQKRSKQNLLDLTLGQERVYSQLLEQTLSEQEEVLNDIKNLSNAVTFISQRALGEGENFDPDSYMSLLDYKTQVLYNFNANAGDFSGDFAWPTDPDLGISAYFRDPSYAGRFGIQHNAIDIPVYQGSPVRAATDGVVYTVRDNGYGYSYVILAHASGFMTVYGHISSILVEEGDTVTSGAIIGLSGGMPGTKGAGYMTTGPHIHFEVLMNGLYVDPLDYLALEALSEESAYALPEKYWDDWENAVFRLDFEGILR